MDLDKLLELADILKTLTGGHVKKSENKDDSYLFEDLIGEFVIVRCRDAGVHAGTLVKASGRSCVLKNSRRLWYFKCARSISLSAVQGYGLSDESRLGAVVDTIVLTENCEIMTCSEKAQQDIETLPVTEAS